MTKKTAIKHSSQTPKPCSWFHRLGHYSTPLQTITLAILIFTVLFTVLGCLVVMLFSIKIKLPIEISQPTFILIGIIATVFSALLLLHLLMSLRLFTSRGIQAYLRSPNGQILPKSHYGIPATVTFIFLAGWLADIPFFSAQATFIVFLISLIGVLIFQRYYWRGRSALDWAQHIDLALPFFTMNTATIIFFMFYATHINSLLGTDVQSGWETWLLFIGVYVFMAFPVFAIIQGIRTKILLKVSYSLIAAILLTCFVFGGVNLGAGALAVLGQGGGIVRDFWIQDDQHGFSKNQLNALKLPDNPVKGQALTLCLWGSDGNSWYVSVDTTKRQLGKRCVITKDMAYQRGIVAIDKKVLAAD